MPPLASPATTCWKKFAISRSVAEVGGADAFVLLELFARGVQCDGSDLEHVRVLRRGERDLRILLDDEHAQPVLLVERPDDPEQLAHDRRCETKRGLVEQQEARPRDERARER